MRRHTEQTDDERAVSPVIGVILMVAITVILAAVIATFVLGLGEQISSTAPDASWSTDTDNQEIVIEDDTGVEETYDIGIFTHRAGPAIENENLRVSGPGLANSTIDGGTNDVVELDAIFSADEETTASETVTFAIEIDWDLSGGADAFEGDEGGTDPDEIILYERGDEIDLIWEDQGDSAVLRTIELRQDVVVVDDTN